MIFFRRKQDHRSGRRWFGAGERGASGTGYALTIATLVTLSLAAISNLQTSSDQYLDNTGSQIGQPKTPREVVVTSLVDAPPAWAQNTLPPPPPVPPATPFGPASVSSPSAGGQCIEIVAGILQLAPCGTGNEGQSITGVLQADGSLVLQVTIAGVTSCIQPISAAQGSGYGVAPCDGSAAQSYTQLDDPLGHNYINSATGFCLELDNGGTAAGTPIVGNSCDGEPDQAFNP